MARSIATRQVVPLQIDPSLEAKEIGFWRRPRGKNIVAPLTDIPPTFASEILNLRVDRGVTKSRIGTTRIPGSVVTTIEQAGEFGASDGSHFFNLGYGLSSDNKVYKYDRDNVVWALIGTLPGARIMNSNIRAVSFAGGLFIPTTSKEGVFWDVGAGTLVAATLPGGAGIPLHFVVFGGRVVACTDQFQVSWSVKDNALDWTGLGSGFEDLSTSSSGLNQPRAVVPLTDTQAIVIRDSALWLMTVTGFVDAPFDFKLLASGRGSIYSGTAVATPYGVAFVADDNVFVTGQGPIGDAVMAELRPLLSTVFPGAAIGYYSDQTREYRVIPQRTGKIVFAYNFGDQAWYKYTYPSSVFWLTYTSAGSYGSGQTTAGGWDKTLSGGVVARENATDAKDVDGSDARVDTSIEVRTGTIESADPLHQVEIIQVKLEYEASASQTLIFEYSDDGGSSWNSYSQIDIVVTTKPSVLTVRRTLARNRLQLRVRSTILGKLTIISMTPLVVNGKEILTA